MLKLLKYEWKACARTCLPLYGVLILMSFVTHLLYSIPQNSTFGFMLPAISSMLYMGVMMAAFIVRALLYYVISYWGHTFGILVEADIRRDLFTHVQELDVSFFDHNRTGQLMSRLTSDLFEITELAHHGPEDLLISTLTIVGALAILFSIEWRLALVVACILPVFIAVIMSRRSKMTAASRGEKQKTAAINVGIESSLSGIRTRAPLPTRKRRSTNSTRRTRNSRSPSANSTTRWVCSTRRWNFL